MRDGPPPGYSWPTMWAILFAFWTIGAAATIWASTLRVVHVEVTDSGAVDVTWRWPFRVERRRIEAAEMPTAEMIYGADNDGDPYFTSRVTRPRRHHRPRREPRRGVGGSATARFNATAGRRRGARSQPPSP